MGFFNDFFRGIKRSFRASSAEVISEEKSFGDEAEVNFEKGIQRLLPEASIKSNVIVADREDERFAEIDSLILYKGNLFAVEIKHWLGHLTYCDDCFISEKIDRYTGEVHIKELRSPFDQLRRAISLLKKEVGASAWIEPIVFIWGADEVNIPEGYVWFDDIRDVASYIKDYDGSGREGENKRCFERAAESDMIAFKNGNRVNCRITGASPESLFTREQTEMLELRHRFAHDDVTVYLADGKTRSVSVDDGVISAEKGRESFSYYLKDIDYIYIGR